ncbi:chromosomal replication initiator DnaA [Amaricoccus tamworthensis]|uniref:chromosomal replication initiator DnaA n=1 Tax=Amaricoccus tamworthensis TaxID=57002 RepID=UPI003C7ECD8C
MTARQLAFDLPVRPALGRSDYFVSPTNKLALAQIDTWPAWPEGRMALAGPAGSGKTHLAHVWAAEAGARILHVNDLDDLSLEAVAGDANFVLEDADGVAGRDGRQEVLFHLCNHLRANGGSLLLTAREAPGEWGLTLPDLESRLRVAGVAWLTPPDDALLAAVLVKLFADRQVEVAPELIRYLVPRMDRSIAAAESLVAALDRRALELKRPVNVYLASEFLRAGDGAG